MVEWHANDWAPGKGHFSAPERLEWMATHLPDGLQNMKPRDHRHNSSKQLCLRESYVCPAICCSGLIPTRSSLWPTTWWTSWIGCLTSIITPVSIRRSGHIPRVSRKETKSGCNVQSEKEGSHSSSSHHKMVHARWSITRIKDVVYRI
jgi:hypothetical protein